MNVNIKLYHTYRPKPSMVILGSKSSALSCDTNARNIYGCNAAIKVKELEETPGVLEKVSISNPIINPHRIIIH